MSVKLLHMSDMHLDAPFATLGVTRRAELRAALGRILALARERRVDLVTIAGDLYEQAYTLPDTAAFLVQQFERLAPIRIVIAPGECDPYTSDSLYALTRWPDNVTIFSKGQLTALELASGIQLWGAASPPARGFRTLAPTRADMAGVNLLLLHAMDTEAATSDVADLFTLNAAAVRKAGFTLALLGHDHAARLWPDEEPCCLYPGSPEPLAAEADVVRHTVALVTVADDALSFEHIPINQWTHRAISADLTGCADLPEAAARVQQKLDTTADAQRVYEVTLMGTPDEPLDPAAVLAEVQTQAHLYGRASFSLPYDLEGLAQEQTVRGLLVRRYQSDLARVKDESERHRRLSALVMTLQALDGRQVQPYEIA